MIHLPEPPSPLEVLAQHAVCAHSLLRRSCALKTGGSASGVTRRKVLQPHADNCTIINQEGLAPRSLAPTSSGSRPGFGPRRVLQVPGATSRTCDGNRMSIFACPVGAVVLIVAGVPVTPCLQMPPALLYACISMLSILEDSRL